MKNVDDLLDKIKKKQLLVIFPHPDDETVMTTGLIQRALKRNWNVKVVCLTAGEAGQIHTNGNGKSLINIRKSEMTKAIQVLGVDDFKVCDFPDGNIKTTKAWKKYLFKKLRWDEYGLVVTYDHSGVTGHPDHIALSVEVKSQISKLQNESRPVLLWVSMKGLSKEIMVNSKVIPFFVEADYKLSSVCFHSPT